MNTPFLVSGINRNSSASVSEDKPRAGLADNGETAQNESVHQKGTAMQDVWSALSNLEGDIDQFAQDVSEAAEKLVDAMEKVGETAEHLYDGVGQVAEGVLGMTAEEVALTAVLVQRLAAGGGLSSDEMLSMVQKCRESGSQAENGSVRYGATVGDLVIPGKVFLLECGAGESGGVDNEAQEEGSCGGGKGTARRTSSKELGGIRLSNRMVDDHSMDAYEPAIIAAAQRCSRD